MRRGILGLERIGLAVLAAPLVSTAIAIFLTIGLAAAAWTWIGFNGEVAHVLRSSSQATANFARAQAQFGRIATDRVIFVRSPQLATAQGFERLRALHLDLQLIDEVGAAFSIFSLGERGLRGRDSYQLPARIEDDAALAAAIKRLHAEQPATRSMFSLKPGAALLLALPAQAVSRDAAKPQNDGRFTRAAEREITQLLEEYRGQGFEIALVGRSEMRRAVVSSLVRDQVVLTGLAIAIAVAISMFLFRSVGSALVCTLAPVIAMIWYLGLFTLLGFRIDFLNTVVPALIVILAYADGLHLFFQWRRLCDGGVDPLDALKRTILEVGPACALASMTTGLAFLALIASSNQAITHLALAGALGVLILFLAVITIVPLTAYWLVKAEARFAPAGNRLLTAATPLAIAIANKHRAAAISLALVLSAALIVVHFTIPSNFRITNYLPSASGLQEAEAQVNKLFGGSGQIRAILIRENAHDTVTSKEVVALARIQDILEKHLGPARTVSLADVQGRETLTGDGAARARPIKLGDIPEQGQAFLNRFVARDKSMLAVGGFIELSESSNDFSKRIEKIEADFDAAGLGARVFLTGVPVFIAHEHPVLIDSLRKSLLLAVIISIIVISLALRSLRLGLACFLPNLLPILAVEAVIWLLFGEVEMTGVIALAIGFGIAIDDSVHLLNHFRLSEADGDPPEISMTHALNAVSPAVVATTLTLAVELTVTFTSQIPAVGVFGGVVIGVLVFALLGNLFLLPALATALKRWHP